MDATRVLRTTPWRHLPNALSLLRIACAPLLVLFAVTGQQAAYTWVLVPALTTDALDGWIARSCGLQSRLGARLDTLGDSLTWCAGLAGLLAFQRDVLWRHRWLIGAIVVLWALENLCAWWRYGRLSSFHTVLAKVSGVLLGIYLATLFMFGQIDVLLYLAAGASLLTSLEELVLLALLPEWRSDLKGLWWLYAERRRSTTSRRGTPAGTP
jgi:phosphatidylglycerophosphate synthase